MSIFMAIIKMVNRWILIFSTPNKNPLEKTMVSTGGIGGTTNPKLNTSYLGGKDDLEPKHKRAKCDLLKIAEVQEDFPTIDMIILQLYIYTCNLWHISLQTL